MEDGTALETHRYTEAVWIMAPGLDTLASASADSERVHADLRCISFQEKKRKNPFDGIFGSGKNIDMNKTDLLADALAAVIEPPTLISGSIDRDQSKSSLKEHRMMLPAPTVGSGTGKVPILKVASKIKSTTKTAAIKTSVQLKPKTMAASTSALSSASVKTKREQNDSDSSDSDGGGAPFHGRLPSAGLQSAPEELSNGDSTVESVVVIPQRALTVRERHRECNRLVARKTRVKKKIELDLLQNSFNDYRCSNNTLRTLLKAVVTREISAHILLDCNFQLPNNVVAIVAEMLAAKECQHYITCGEMGSCLRSFCITNPTVFDNPIAYASQDFGELTGYDTQSIIGYNCRFLQGAESDPREVYRLKIAVERGCNEQVVVRNYRRDGTVFWNLIHISPVCDAHGKVVLIVGCHSEVFQFFSDSGLEMFSTKQPSIQLLASQSIYDQELVKERDHMQDRYVKREIQKVDEMTIYDSEVAITIGSGSRASIKNNFIIPSTASINGTSELTVPLFIPDSLPHSHSHSQSPSHIQSVSAFQLDHLNDMKSNNNFPLKNGRSNMEIPI